MQELYSSGKLTNFGLGTLLYTYMSDRFDKLTSFFIKNRIDITEDGVDEGTNYFEENGYEFLILRY